MMSLFKQGIYIILTLLIQDFGSLFLKLFRFLYIMNKTLKIFYPFEDSDYINLFKHLIEKGRLSIIYATY